ncbi:hypothetical protein BN7_6474 [Wickerhamomyces ciferrii]|uniref:non-specific serine/threonine protein kinase n=1 Tax=Wickerhamomyces ciferrii (strain ATCC 14091 / BCRC 22168 / CBS 111 / JCM 3599 / NBRC 0793 / NRRL Y-1031 F-60-10) TaxID=1206466 RepID=K0KXU1_WICCF|nr:uncharacterized protein BN7_6474 [Wickerhamomyces ciferrii]CCH46872.1 hypothetical protein BN7_6474 [Wickerhamomyces ciferrii]
MGDPTVTTRRQSFQSKSTKKTHKEIRFGSYVLGSTLGEGEFGKVKLGWKKDGSQPSQVAIKFIRRDSIPRGSERESKVHREINALKRLSHPNIVTLEEVLQNDKYIGIVLEYASGGELFDYILQHRYLKDSLACRLFSQLVSGVHYMHSKGIVHRDLKLENLLLDKHKNIIITDFGFVNSFGPYNDLMKTSCGSPCYAAPELVISNEPYESKKVDVWSCGVILYAMLAGYLPFDDDPQNPDGDNIARLYQYITNTHLTFPEYIEPMPRDLLRRILVPNPKKRLTLREVRGHQWLAPHAPFLSVTPAEWDKNYKTNNEYNANIVKTQRNLAVKNEIRRYSLIDTTSASLQNHNVSNHFFSNPLPPQTSSNHAIALPSSTSSTSINEQLRFSPKGHHRSSSVQSYSSASLALQAVVDADETRHTPIPSNQQGQQPDMKRRNSDTRRPSAPFIQGIPRSTTHTGIPTLGDVRDTRIKETIQEQTPLNPSFKTPNFAVPKIPKTSDTCHNSNAKLPGPGPNGRKPRPTSYHPGLYSLTGNNQLSPTGFDSSNSPVIRSESTNSISSLTNGKISQPSVDLSSAEGDIIKPKSPNILSSKKFSVDESDENISEKLINLKSDESFENNEYNNDNDTNTTNNNNNNNINEKESTSNNEKTVKSSSTVNSSSYNDKKKNRYSAVIAAEIVLDKIFGSSGSNDDSKNKLNESSDNLQRSQSHTSSVHSNNSKPSNLSTNTKNTSVQESPDQQFKKHSNNSKTRLTSGSSSDVNNLSTSNSNRTKRFSFLQGFYGNNSNENTAPSSTQSQQIHQQHQQRPRISESNSSNTTTTTSTRKVLEPSNEINIPRKSQQTNRENRKSTIDYPNSQRKEPSTAKKVMDFFKRRSMRVG